MGTKNYFFASANTGDGFVSNLDKINEDDGKNFMYIISGGSGCGKSTMMKKIGEYFFQQGESVEYFLCSSDPMSLDGVRLVDKNVAIVDGTAPHIIMPNLVGVDSKIIDIGQFVNIRIIDRRSEIENIILQKKKHYQNVNFYLAKLKSDYDKILEKQSQNFNINFVNKTVKDLYSKIKTSCNIGKSRTLFLNCVNDVKVDLTKLNKFKEIVFDANEFETNLIFIKLVKILDKNNFQYIKILNNINANLIEKIIINNKILTNNNNFNYIFNKKIIKLVKNEIKKAKYYHKKIEDVYKNNINFLGVDKLTNAIIEEIKQR